MNPCFSLLCESPKILSQLPALDRTLLSSRMRFCKCCIEVQVTPSPPLSLAGRFLDIFRFLQSIRPLEKKFFLFFFLFSGATKSHVYDAFPPSREFIYPL